LALVYGFRFDPTAGILWLGFSPERLHKFDRLDRHSQQASLSPLTLAPGLGRLFTQPARLMLPDITSNQVIV
jgi:hypothetical protein